MKINVAALSITLGGVGMTNARPNFIVVQPDDFQFFEDWDPPAHFPGSDIINDPPLTSLPNIERLRSGLQMRQAYTASPMCGTSRFSTVTSRYPSRSAYGRESDISNELRDVTIPKTKLMDIDTVFDGKDCSSNNLAALLKANDYATGVVGKWHLYEDDSVQYNYEALQDEIRNCGFDYAEAIYKGNLDSEWAGNVTHNMEHVASRAVEFITNAHGDSNKDGFFLYLNPTVPHGSGNVRQSLRDGDCMNTVEGSLDSPPSLPYYNESSFPFHAMHNDPLFGGDCGLYRQSVIDRAPNGKSPYKNHELGSIWIDDALGAVLATLEHLGELENTFILFQMDHGQEGKGSLFEPGIRLAQFIYYPDAFPTAGSVFEGPVSTIDIGPTMLEYAGITSSSTGYYEMDGMSWKKSVEHALDPESHPDSDSDFDSRCLIFEMDRDRAIRCGCDKFISINNVTEGGHIDKINALGYVAAEDNLFNLCDGSDSYIDVDTPSATNPEAVSIDWEESFEDTEKLLDMQYLIDCHDVKTSPARIPDYKSTCGEASYCQDFNSTDDCNLILEGDSCENRQNQYRCMVTCGLCDPTNIDDNIRLARKEIQDIILAEPFWAGKFIRMGFHDAVGGVDGCIDMENGDNAGLQAPIDALAPVVEKYENAVLGISRADIWALAALTGADTALPAAERGRFPLTHVGRINCEDVPIAEQSCPNGCDVTNGPDRQLPSPHLTTHGLLGYFFDEFGFNDTEIVALMGAHTLGRMSPENSGFDGAWVSNENTLNNQYYQVLVGGENGDTDSEETMIRDALNWELEEIDTNPDIPRFQWFHTTPAGVKTAMTNSDIALVRDLDGDLNIDGSSTCRFKCRSDTNCANTRLAPVCPAAAALLNQVANYKEDNDQWVNDFEAVLKKMMDHGYDASTSCLDDVCIIGQLLATSRNLRGPARIEKKEQPK